jgi:hypothetical protein
VASLAHEERAVADEPGGEDGGVPGVPQRNAQLLRLPNGRQVRAEALEQDVLIGGNPGLDNFLDGHDHPHLALRRHLIRDRARD